MKLGRFESLKAELTKLFGECYTDDNAVVLLDGDQSDVAYLWPTAKQNELKIQFVDRRRKSIVIHVDGAGEEPHETKRRLKSKRAR